MAVIVRHTRQVDLEDSEEAAAAGELLPSDWNGDDAHVVEGAAPIDSPAFVGTPTGTTPPLGDASLRLATMEALAAAVAHAVASAAITPKPVTFAMSPYVPLAADQLLQVDTSGGAIIINMTGCAARNGVALEIKDATGNAVPGGNVITVNRSGAELFDNAATIVIDSPFGTLKLQPKTAGGYLVV